MTLSHLREWKILESRAILEVVRGRLDIVDKFHEMIVNDAPETPHRQGDESLHALVADYPWLISPEWQVLYEEKTVTKQLREWGHADIPENDRTRYDFLALEGSGQMIVIEIKRAGHAVELRDLHQIEQYVDQLGRARPQTRGAFLTSESYALSEATMSDWKKRQNIELLTWAEVHARVRSYYEHYRALLEGDVGQPVLRPQATGSCPDTGCSGYWRIPLCGGSQPRCRPAGR